MKNLVVVLVIAFAFNVTVTASDIAFYVGQFNIDGWYGEEQFTDVETIIAETGHLFNGIQQFNDDDLMFAAFNAWVEANTNDGEMDIIWLNGCTPSGLYPNPNELPDGSRIEAWLDGGNMVINVGDWFAYATYEGGPRGGEGRGGDNGGDGAANILDLSSGIIVGADGTMLTVTPTGQEYLPSLGGATVKTDRPVVLSAVQAPWEVAAVFASSGGTDDPAVEAQGDPIVIHNTETGGYVAFVNQASGGPDGWIADRGLTCAEFISNWVNEVVGLSAVEPVNPGTGNLVHSWTFDDGTADDVVGDAEGVLIGDAAVVDGQLVLDGDGDWMEMPGDIIAINTFEGLTIEIQFTSVAGGNTGYHMVTAFGEEGTGDNPGYGYKYVCITPARGNDVSRAMIQTVSMDNDPWSEETGVSDVIEHDDGLPHHMVCTVDDTELAFYIDGVLIGTAALDPPGNSIAGLGTDVARIGKGVYGVDPLWAGSVDYLNLYNKALSEREVRYLAGERATPVDPGTDGLVAYYPLDIDALDASGNGYDGILNGDPQWVDGKVGGALEMDGGDYVEVPGAADINPESITLMTWVNFSTVDGADMQRQDYLSRGDDYAFSLHEWGYRDGTEAEGKISAIVTSAGGWTVLTGTTLVESETWYHTTLTYESGTQILKLYLDGEVEGQMDLPTGLEHRLGGPLTIGTYNGRDLLGKIDDVKIYDRALSVGEIRYLVGFRAMDNPGTDALIAAYPFENDVLDASGNGNDATVNGDPAFVEGLVGIALEFDGDGDFLDCGANPMLALTDAVSISAWIKVAVAGADHKVGGNQDGANGGYKMSVYGDKIEFEIRTASNSAVLNRSVAGGTIIEVDTWYNVVGVYSLKDGYIRTYVNGELDRELLTTEALGASPGSLIIGAEPFNTGSYNFNGIMDEVKVYNKALTAAEARYIANN